MISFKQFLEESKSAPLYHATSVENAMSIFNSNVLKPTLSIEVSDPKLIRRFGKPTNFLTRSLQHAKFYGKEMHGSREMIIFEIDQQKLSQRYKIAPLRNWLRTSKNNAPMYRGRGVPYGNEFEEMVDKPIANFFSYVNVIHVPRISYVANFEFIDKIMLKYPHFELIKY